MNFSIRSDSYAVSCWGVSVDPTSSLRRECNSRRWMGKEHWGDYVHGTTYFRHQAKELKEPGVDYFFITKHFMLILRFARRDKRDRFKKRKMFTSPAACHESVMKIGGIGGESHASARVTSD